VRPAAGGSLASPAAASKVLFVTLRNMTLIMGEATSCLAQLDSVTLIYRGGDVLGVPF